MYLPGSMCLHCLIAVHVQKILLPCLDLLTICSSSFASCHHKCFGFWCGMHMSSFLCVLLLGYHCFSFTEIQKVDCIVVNLCII